MTDIVERLRLEAIRFKEQPIKIRGYDGVGMHLCNEAATEIERLRAEVAQARGFHEAALNSYNGMKLQWTLEKARAEKAEAKYEELLQSLTEGWD